MQHENVHYQPDALVNVGAVRMGMLWVDVGGGRMGLCGVDVGGVRMGVCGVRMVVWVMCSVDMGRVGGGIEAVFDDGFGGIDGCYFIVFSECLIKL